MNENRTFQSQLSISMHVEWDEKEKTRTKEKRERNKEPNVVKILLQQTFVKILYQYYIPRL